MKIKDLIEFIEEGEKICIQNEAENVLEINEVEHISNNYIGCKVIKFYSERYPAFSTIGITFVVELEH